MEDSPVLLSVRDLKTHFFSREGITRAVNGVSFDVKRGETLGIAGESGCGKSVMVQSILRLVPQNGRIVDGEILFDTGDGRIVDLAQMDPDGRPMRRIRGSQVSMIFQEPMTSFSPVHTIGNQITEVIRLHQGATHREAREQAIEMLARVDMPNPVQILDAYPFNLSGGMRQRAMIAMALCCRPSLLIADEPTTALDVTIQAQVLELIGELQEEFNMTLIIITHDLAVIAELADRVMIMYLGESVEYGTIEDIFYNPKHPYTQGLLRSIPQLGDGTSGKIIEPIHGAVPSPYARPSGCSFHPRCAHFMPGTCDQMDVPYFDLQDRHQVRCLLHDPVSNEYE